MHIEPTSRCTLSCPACPRTWFSDKFNRAFPKFDLDINQLERFLDCDAGNKIDRFSLNGNHGDPIYYPFLLELLKKFRSNKTYKISTNGSYRTVEFWKNLRDILEPNDTVYFSLDGLEHNNHLYRRNSDWNSIVQGIDILKQGSARLVCKTLVFAHNQNEIDKIRDFAFSKGMEFVYESTHRFGDQSLMPTESNIDISRLYDHSHNATVLDPQCSTQEYISADGYYWPCCWITTYHTLHQTKLWKEKNLWAIEHQTLDQARMRLDQWKQEIICNPTQAHSVCKMNCKPGQEFKWAKF